MSNDDDNSREAYLLGPKRYNLTSKLQTSFADHYKSLAINYNAALNVYPYNLALQSFFLNSSFFMDTDVPFTSSDVTQDSPSRNIIFGSWGDKTIDFTTCAVAAHYLTGKVACASHNSTAKTQCRAIAVRKMPKSPTGSGHTFLGMDSVGRGLMKYFPMVISNGGMNGSTPTGCTWQTHVPHSIPKNIQRFN